MSSRDDVLARVRAATQAVRVEPQEVPRGYRQNRPDADLVELFVERVADYRATVVRCGESDVEDQIAQAVAACETVIVPDGLGRAVPHAISDDGQDAYALNDIQAVVTACTLGIAVTGTIVLEHGRPGQGRRALSLVPDTHVCLVMEKDIVADVPDAFTRLDPRFPNTFISGPSATSDIELSRVEGVHGPRNLHVIVIS